jgi:inner membrane protein
MPTAFTHGFSGAAISALAPRRFRGPKLTLALAALAALPDLDVVTFRLGIPYADPFGHRGFSHSLTLAVLLALVLPPLLYRHVSLLSRAGAGLFFVFFAAVASHGFLDAFTDAGLGVGFFIPFSNQRFFFPWRPILTAPVSVYAFFHGHGLRIMQNELLWIWAPFSVLVGAVVLLGRRLH